MATESRIRLFAPGPEQITLKYAQARVKYGEQGERIYDRQGLLHRISSGCARYPTELAISLLPEELTALSSGGTVRTVLAWLEYHFRAQSELVVYIKGDTLADDGGAVARYLAYKARLDELPAEYFGTLPVIGDGPEYIEVRLTVHEDGEFSDFDDLGSYTPYLPARPGTE